MTTGDRPISVSLSTIDFLAGGQGTRLVFAEQGIHFDGAGTIEGRKEGSRWLLERLARGLDGIARPGRARSGAGKLGVHR
jgi:hypothetical protein